MWFISSFGPWNETKRRTKSGHRAPFVWLRCFCCFAQWFRQKFTPAVRKDFSSKSLELKKKRKSSKIFPMDVLCYFKQNLKMYFFSSSLFIAQRAFRSVGSNLSLQSCKWLKAMSHEAICPCNLQCNFCRKKYCRLQLGYQMYATCFTTCNKFIFYARRVFKNVSGILIMSYCDWIFLKKLRDKLQWGVARCNLSRSIAKSRSCFYFLCNLERNFSLRY